MGCHSFLQGIFKTQGSNPDLRWRQALLPKTGVKSPLEAKQEPYTTTPVFRQSRKTPWTQNHLFLPSFALDILSDHLNMLTSEKSFRIPTVENGVMRITEANWGDSKIQVQCLAHPSFLPCPQTRFLTYLKPSLGKLQLQRPQLKPMLAYSTFRLVMI